MTEAIDDIHQFWFGELDDTGMCSPEHHPLWFGSSAMTDEYCRSHFGHLLVQAVAGELASWTETDRGLIALVVLLDQFSRNIHRGAREAFAGDSAALELARRTIAGDRHHRLPAIHRVFLYLPLEHCEDLEAQEQCVSLFEQLSTRTGSGQIANFTRYAVAHRDVIARFGRFPHRNAILGRQSSAAELAYLEQHGGF